MGLAQLIGVAVVLCLGNHSMLPPAASSRLRKGSCSVVLCSPPALQTHSTSLSVLASPHLTLLCVLQLLHGLVRPAVLPVAFLGVCRTLLLCRKHMIPHTLCWPYGICLPLPRSFFTESYGQLFFLSPSSVCALAWGLGRLRWRPPRDWQDRLFLETYSKLAGFRPGELAGRQQGLGWVSWGSRGEEAGGAGCLQRCTARWQGSGHASWQVGSRG